MKRQKEMYLSNEERNIFGFFNFLIFMGEKIFEKFIDNENCKTSRPSFVNEKF